jgi:hypothetical protein
MIQTSDNDWGLLSKLKLSSHGAVIAGGAAARFYQKKNIEHEDVDIWFETEEYFKFYKDNIKNFVDSVLNTMNTANAVTYDVIICKKQYKIQLIKRFYPTTEELLDSFDISVCQVATDGEQWFLGQHFAKDLKNHKLRVVKYHSTLLKRLFKYWSYGYQPDDETLKKILSNPDINWKFDSISTDDY